MAGPQGRFSWTRANRTLTALGAALRELPDPWGVDLRHTWASESPYAALVEDTHTAPSV